MKLTVITKTIGALHGASQSGIDLILACNQTEHDVTVIHRYGSKIPNNIDGYYFKKLKIYKAAKNLKIETNLNFKKIKRWLDSKLFDYLRDKKINNIKSDIVIVNSISGHELFKSNKYNYNKYNVLVVRESPRHFEYKFNEPNALEKAKKMMAQYKKYIFVSSNVLNEWKNILSLSTNQCTYVPNCIHEKEIKKILLSQKKELKNKYNFLDKDFNIICVASVQYRKGQDIIIALLEKLKKNIPNLKLHLVGNYKENDPYYLNLINHKNYMKYKKDIKFWGKRKDACKIIYISDLFLLPTRAEAFPRVILESMALKVPIASSNVDGIPEMLDNNNSILFSHDNYDKLIKELTSIYNNKNLTEKLINNASKKYWNNFSRKKQIKRINNFLKGINN